MSDAPYGERRNPSSRFLPPDPSVSAPYRLTPGLAVRVGVLGIVALAVFALLFFRLWSLQVLSGARYLNEAQNNQLRTIRIEAPRGPILDREGRVIVGNVPGTAVKLWVGDMPKKAGRYRMIRRLAAVLDVPVARLAREVDDRRVDPLTPITVKTAVHDDQVYYLQEHASEFPGVQIQQTYLRDYPYQSLAAQVLGYVGEISPQELKARQGQKADYRGGDTIGKSGVEAAFDGYLRGASGAAQIRVDSLGRPQSPLELRRDARPGTAVRLTLDIKLQRAAERAIREGIALARANKQYNVAGGAVIAIDPRDGAVRAMASYPTYKPSVYVGRIDPKKLAPLVNNDATKAANFPGLNRVTQVAYPPGSTWKPVTALAAMQEHLLSPYSSIQCTGSATYGADKQVFRNWDPYVNRPMTLPEALATSCDTYFYDVGNRFYQGGAAERSRLQQWARKFGFGAPTGLDIGNEAPSWQTIVPTPAWRKQTFKSDWDKAWNPGDSIQLPLLRDDRERRQARDALRGLGRRAARNERAAARHAAAVPARSAARRGRRPSSATGRAGGALRRHPLHERHVVGRVRVVSDLDLGQDRDGREGRQPARLPRRSHREPVVVVRVRPLGRRQARRLRGDRERRPRLGGRRARGAACLRAVLPPEGRNPVAEERRLIVDTRHRPSALRSPSVGLVDVGSLVRSLDWLLLTAAAALVAYGLWAIGGITRFDVPGSPDYFVNRQAIAAALGVVGMVVAILIPPSFYQRHWRFIYGGTIGVMLFVFVFAEAVRGSKRWIDLGPFQLQPSEFGKTFFVLAIAGFLVERGRRVGELGTVAAAVGLGLVPMGLVFMQPDLGTALVYGAALMAVLFLAGVRWLHLVVLAVTTIVLVTSVLWALPAAGVAVLKPYQTARLTGFTNPASDPSGLTYNVTQSRTAVGAGGLSGRGVEGASQTRLDYLPEHATDFVFASFAEQRGFVGTSILLLLYLLVVWRGLRVVTVAGDLYGAVVAGGIVFAFLFQVFVNVGMTMGIAPVTGIPLPYVTVGGSSMVANLVAIGVLQAIHARGLDERRR